VILTDPCVAAHMTRAVAALFAVLITSGLGAQSDAPASSWQRSTPWRLAYEHYDSRIGEGGAGIDIVTSRTPRPAVLATRPRGSDEHFYDPQVSPDGTHVAYLRAASRFELYVLRDDGTERRRLASGQFQDFLWSADSGDLAFTADCGFDFQGGCRAGHIDVVSRDGTVRRVLHRPTNLSRSAEIELQHWSRRGDLLYILRDRGRATLYRVDADGRSAALASSDAGGVLGEASWSRDGAWIAYMRRCITPRSDTFCDIAVMNRDGARSGSSGAVAENGLYPTLRTWRRRGFPVRAGCSFALGLQRSNANDRLAHGPIARLLEDALARNRAEPRRQQSRDHR
jgi:Tol biopolymer transport system component